MDLISRQAAINELKAMYHAAEKWGEEASDDTIKARAESCMASLVEMKLRIENLPSAQPERKKGRWIRMYYNRPKQYTRICTECSKICWFCGIGDYNYCPWCGARMKGEEDETD